MAIDPITVQSIIQEASPRETGIVNDPRYLKVRATEGQSFADMIKEAVQSVDEMQKITDRGVEDILAGKAENIHEVMISMEKAQLSFQMMVEIRNKAIETYQELSRMQI